MSDNEKICPTCGTEYPANERFCPRDGTALRSQGGSTDLVGSIVAERYHVMKKLGEGGMGQVYLAEHVKMGRKSALKVMNPGMVNDADAISRFNREAANASRINHPNVAGIYDFGETADGLIYLAMEFIEGQSLTALVEANGALAPLRAAEIARQTGEGLQVAHDMGIVHRDLKPDNIMIAKNRDGSDCVKVVDFGIAKAAGAENQKVTKTGLVVGTPEYMSPEQLAGDKLDGRSDIYSLGLVTFNMLTGKLPFQAESAQESMIMRLTDEPKTLQEMKPDTSWPPEVQTVMRKALERRAGDRYQKAADFGRDLYMAMERMPKQAAGATMVMGATDGATAVMTAPPPTRIDASAAAAAVPVAPAPVAATPARSRTPMYASGVVAIGLAAAATVYFARGTSKAGAIPPVAASDTMRNVGSVTAPAQGGTQTPAISGNQRKTALAPTGNSSVRPNQTVQDPASPNTSPAGVSYAKELEALDLSLQDDTTSRKAYPKLEDLRSRITLAGEKAEVLLLEGKAKLFMNSGAEACKIFRSIKHGDLMADKRKDLDDGLATCQ